MIPGKVYTPEDVLRIGWRRKWLLLVPVVLITAATAVWAYRQPNQYKSETLILVVPQRVPESYVRSTVTTRIEDRLSAIAQQILSRTRLEQIIKDFNLYQVERTHDVMENVVDRMRSKDIDIQTVKGDAFKISFVSDSAKTAMSVTERLASLFIEENLRDREVLAEGTDKFLESELDDARRRLIDNEKKLEEYRVAHAGELPSQMDANIQALHNTQMQIQSLTDSLSRDRDRQLTLQRSLADAAPVPRSAAAAVADVGATVSRLQQARAQLQALQQRFTDEHPTVVRQKRVVADLEQQADIEARARLTGEIKAAPPPVNPADVTIDRHQQELKAELAGVDREIASREGDEASLRAQAGEYQRQIDGVPAREAELAELTRDYETLQAIYRTLLGKKEDSKVSANLERRQIGEQFRVLDPARLPERPFSPNRPRIMMISLVAGLVIGLVLVGGLEYFDRTLRTEDDALAALGLPVLAAIPSIAEASGSRWRVLTVSIIAVALTTAVVVVAVLRFVH